MARLDRAIDGSKDGNGDNTAKNESAVFQHLKQILLRSVPDHLVTTMQVYTKPLAPLSILLIAVLVATSSSMAENTVDFSKSTNLKALYDAGLRPWRVRPDESDILHITNQKVRVIAPSGGSFVMDVEIGGFGLLAGNQLRKADFISQPTSLQEALTQAREAAKALGIDVSRGDGMGGLVEKASEFAALGGHSSAPQSWRGQSEIDGVRYGVTLNPLFGLNETRGKVYVTLDFYQRGKPMKFLMEPIKPPPSYEHMSMEPPPRDPNQKPFPNPEYSFENMVKRVEEAIAAEGQSSSPTMRPSARAPTTTLKPSPVTQVEQPKTAPWPWIIGAIFLLAVVGGVFFKFLRK
jgi:hypothetical protein